MTETKPNTSFIAVANLLRAQALIQERFTGELGSVHGLALTEALLLMHLERAPLHRLTRVELAKRLHASPSTVTRMAAPMEKTGLVVRQPDARSGERSPAVFRWIDLASGFWNFGFPPRRSGGGDGVSWGRDQAVCSNGRSCSFSSGFFSTK